MTPLPTDRATKVSASTPAHTDHIRVVEQDMQLRLFAIRDNNQHFPHIVDVINTYLRNSPAALRTDAKLPRSSSRKIASFPVSSLSRAMAASAFSLFREAM